MSNRIFFLYKDESTLCHNILFICFRGVKHVPCPVEEFQHICTTDYYSILAQVGTILSGDNKDKNCLIFVIVEANIVVIVKTLF